MGYIFSTHIESSSGPEGVGLDIQTFTALWDPQHLQKKVCIIYKNKISPMFYFYV